MEKRYKKVTITIVVMLEGLKAWIYRLTHEYQGCGNPDCSVSHGIHEGLTFGSGHLDKFGF